MSALEELAELFAKCLIPQAEVLRNAESRLQLLETHPGFVVLILKLLGSDVAPDVKVVASIFCKNYLRKYWDIAPELGGPTVDDRVFAKTELVNLFVASEPRNRKQLSQCLAQISQVDFPDDWCQLLPELVAKHQQCLSLDLLLGSMELLHVVMKKFRFLERSDEVLSQLKRILPSVQFLLFEPFKQSVQCFVQGVDARNWAQVLLYCCKVFYSCHTIDLPEFFEDNMKTFFGGFLAALNTHNPACSGRGSDVPDIEEKLKKCIFRNCTIYSDKYQEEFQPFVMDLVKTARTVLVTWSNDSCFDSAVAAGLRFLTSVSRTNWESNFNPLANSEILQQICETVVVPNIQLRKADIEMMEDSPQEFIRMDVDSTEESNTRRGSTLGLVKGLCKFHEETVSSLLCNYVQNLLNQAEAAGANQLSSQLLKDAAVYLLIAVAIKSQTRLRGVAEVNARVDIRGFFQARLLPELEPNSLDERKILRVSALKFVSTFRNQLSTELLVQLLPILTKHLTAQNPVVVSYAAHCLERLMTAREATLGADGRTTTMNGQLRLNPQECRDVLLAALPSLLEIVCTNRGFRENEYVVKCVMRIFLFLQAEATNQVLPTANSLVVVLKAVSQQTTNPAYTHYIFETLACMASIAPKGGPLLASKFQETVLEPLLVILQGGNNDLSPYCFQLIGWLLDTCFMPGDTSASRDFYEKLFVHLLNKEKWITNASSVPGIIRVFASFFRKHEVFKDAVFHSMEKVFEGFQHCLMHKRLEITAFEMLTDIFLHLPIDYYISFMPRLVKVLLTRLQQHSTDRLSKDVVVSLALYVTTWEATPPKTVPANSMSLASILEGIQPGLVRNFFQFVFLPTVVNITVMNDKKLCLYAIASVAKEEQISKDVDLVDKCRSTMASLAGIVKESSSRTNVPGPMPISDTGADDAGELGPQEFQGSFNKISSVVYKTSDKAAHLPNLEGILRGFGFE